MKSQYKIIFFGSTTDSVIVLEKLSATNLVAVVTQPPRPVGREQTITPTPVATWATEHNILTLTFATNPDKPWLFADDQQIIDTLAPFQADLVVSASYGVKIPWPAIQSVKYGGLNIHPSLLPRWRGADPVPWAILSGDHQTGVSVVTLSEKFDAGEIVAQKKIPITDKDTSGPLRTKLFTIGAELLTASILDYITNKEEVQSQITRRVAYVRTSSYARKFTRDDGFEPWEKIQSATKNPEEAARIDRKYRALYPWPGLWTMVKLKDGSGKRLKILNLKLPKSEAANPKLDLLIVQLEGKKPVSFREFTRECIS